MARKDSSRVSVDREKELQRTWLAPRPQACLPDVVCLQYACEVCLRCKSSLQTVWPGHGTVS